MAALVQAQEPAPSRTHGYQFLSGTVVEVLPNELVVRRSPLGKPPQLRRFRLTAETKIEGTLKPKARVTVGYTSGPDGDVAVRVIVRPPAKKPASLQREFSAKRIPAFRAVS